MTAVRKVQATTTLPQQRKYALIFLPPEAAEICVRLGLRLPTYTELETMMNNYGGYSALFELNGRALYWSSEGANPSNSRIAALTIESNGSSQGSIYRAALSERCHAVCVSK